MEQPQYNMLVRDKVEREFRPLYEEIGLGTTIWSPLASGVLTGKYRDGVPEDSRMALPDYQWLRERIESEEGRADIRKAAELEGIARGLGMPLAQLAIAWCLKNPHVSTVILGASSTSQLVENLTSLDKVEHLGDEVLEPTNLPLHGGHGSRGAVGQLHAFESAQRQLGGGEWGGELVGNVAQELPALAIARLHPFPGLLQALGHPVQPLPQPSDLVGAGVVDPGIEVPVGHPGGQVLEGTKASGEHAEEHHPRHPGDQGRHRKKEQQGTWRRGRPDPEARLRAQDHHVTHRHRVRDHGLASHHA